MKRIGWRLVGVLIVTMTMSWGNAFAATPDAVASGRTAQISREGNATVTVTPRSVAAGARSWDFEVVLENHTQALDQDLTKVAALIDAQGQAHPPLAWEGDPPGGHHRRGLLRFRPLAGDPAAVALRLQGIGGVDRVFRWQLK